MKRIGIITLCGNNNFGNKLQNYALLTYLSKLNIDVFTIWIENPFQSNKLKSFLKMIKNKIIDLRNNSRNKSFKDFTKKYLNVYKKKIIYKNDLKRIDEKFDYFIVGSDQVWNYNLMDNYGVYLLGEVDTKKRIAYAASFGVNKLPPKLNPIYKVLLKDFKAISTREKKGKEIVEQLTSRNDVELLIDPTMLLNRIEWDELLCEPQQFKKMNNNKYILNYFLGELNDKRRKEIERIAKENKCEIINILDKNNPFYECGPREFLYLEKNAFLICTDSFHSSVFAFIYDRPFIIFEREQQGVENMNSRLYNLINTFNLKDRFFNGDKITNNNLKHDYSEAYRILEVERNKSKYFLEKALGIKNN